MASEHTITRVSGRDPSLVLTPAGTGQRWVVRFPVMLTPNPLVLSRRDGLEVHFWDRWGSAVMGTGWLGKTGGSRGACAGCTHPNRGRS